MLWLRDRISVGVRSRALAAGVCLYAAVAAAGLAPHPEAARREATLDSLFNESRYDTILALLPTYLTEATALGDSVHFGRLLATRGRVLMVKGRVAESEAAIDSAISIAVALGDTTNWLRALSFQTFLLAGRGEITEAIRVSEKKLALAIAARNVASEGWGRTQLAYLHLQRGELARAEGEYRHAARLFARAGDRESEMTALVGLGRVLQDKADVEGARQAYTQVLRLARDVRNLMDEAYALSNLGGLEFMYGDMALAVVRFEQALELFDRIGFQYGTIGPSLNLGSAYTYLGRYEVAISILTSTLDQCESHGFNNQIGPVLSNIGWTRYAQGRPNAAVAVYRRALSLGEALPQETRDEAIVELATCLAAIDSTAVGAALLEKRFAAPPPPIPKHEAEMATLLARLLREGGRIDDATAWVLRAERRTREDATSARVSTLLELSSCYREGGDLQASLSWFRAALQMEMATRHTTTAHEWREAFGQATHADLLRCGSVMLEHPPTTPQDERVENWYDTVQRFKARTLLERITEPRHRSEIPAMAGVRPVTLVELQSNVLRPGELLLDFSVGDDKTYLFAVTVQSCRMVTLPGKNDRWVRWIETMCRSLASPPQRNDDRGFTQIQAALGEELLGRVTDILNDATNVIIAPDGFISSVPFGVVRVATIGSEQPIALSSTLNLEYVPSATVLRHLRSAASKSLFKPGKGVLVLGSKRGEHGLPLEGATREAQFISRRFRNVDVVWSGSRRAGGLIVSGDQPPEAIHVSAHIVASSERPWRSGILWERGGGKQPADSLAGNGAGRDPYLRAGEIAGMSIPANVAVLSGCESGGGRITAGEGVLGLTAAFLSAGTRAVVAALWPIDDRVTMDLMKVFYEELASGHTAATALRTAQRAISEKTATAHPFYWGAFVLVGDGDVSVDLKRSYVDRVFLFVIVITALIIILVSARAIISRGRRENTEKSL